MNLNQLTHECHLHLYGCLHHEDLWALGAERLSRFKDRVAWFKSEHLRLTGKDVDPETWWQGGDGKDRFKAAFLCDRSLPFDHFQARFNLLIALFPPSPDDMELARAVFSRDSKSHGIKEYRTFLPLYLPENERNRYLRNLIGTALSFQNPDWKPLFAVSFPRGNDETWQAWNFLREFLAANPDLSQYISGIDFCGSERGHPPASKRPFISEVHRYRGPRDRRLEVLYHVGEMWDDIALHSAARWCVEAAGMGVRRLGHALALGLDARNLRDRTIMESVSSVSEHFVWMRHNAATLHESGFSSVDAARLSDLAEQCRVGSWIAWHYSDRLIDLTTRFQEALLAIIARRDVYIECCPTSNIRIGGLRDAAGHPLRRFLRHGIKVTVSTDDPGIFAVDLAHEERICREVLGLNNDAIATLNQTALCVLTNQDEFSRHRRHL